MAPSDLAFEDYRNRALQHIQNERRVLDAQRARYKETNPLASLNSTLNLSQRSSYSASPAAVAASPSYRRPYATASPRTMPPPAYSPAAKAALASAEKRTAERRRPTSARSARQIIEESLLRRSQATGSAGFATPKQKRRNGNRDDGSDDGSSALSDDSESELEEEGSMQVRSVVKELRSSSKRPPTTPGRGGSSARLVAQRSSSSVAGERVGTGEMSRLPTAISQALTALSDSVAGDGDGADDLLDRTGNQRPAAKHSDILRIENNSDNDDDDDDDERSDGSDSLRDSEASDLSAMGEHMRALGLSDFTVNRLIRQSAVDQGRQPIVDEGVARRDRPSSPVRDFLNRTNDRLDALHRRVPVSRVRGSASEDLASGMRFALPYSGVGVSVDMRAVGGGGGGGGGSGGGGRAVAHGGDDFLYGGGGTSYIYDPAMRDLAPPDRSAIEGMSAADLVRKWSNYFGAMSAARRVEEERLASFVPEVQVALHGRDRERLNAEMRAQRQWLRQHRLFTGM